MRLFLSNLVSCCAVKNISSTFVGPSHTKHFTMQRPEFVLGRHYLTEERHDPDAITLPLAWL
jgi:hypothetical protein